MKKGLMKKIGMLCDNLALPWYPPSSSEPWVHIKHLDFITALFFLIKDSVHNIIHSVRRIVECDPLTLVRLFRLQLCNLGLNTKLYLPLQPFVEAHLEQHFIPHEQGRQEQGLDQIV